MNLVEKTMAYLIKAVDGKSIAFESLHPWRIDAVHLLQHALRVKACIEEISVLDNIELNAKDAVALPVAAVLHDIGKLYVHTDHASKSVEVIRTFLEEHFEEKAMIDRINELILDHSNKKERSDDTAMNLLKDADAIDEIGMQSVMMCSNWVDRSSAFFFLDLQSRLEEKEVTYGEKIIDTLYFQGAKDVLKKKINFVKLATTQLAMENAGSLDRVTYERLKNNSGL